MTCFALFVLADAAVLGTDTRWVGELGWTPEWANAGLYLACCLLAGIVAYQSNAYFTPGFLAVVGAGSPARKLRLTMSVWARNVVFGMAGHAIVIALALGITVVTAPTDGLRWQPFVYALLPLTLLVSLGTLVSAFIPHIIGSALACVLAYLMCFSVASGALTGPILVGGYEASLVGIDYASMSSWLLVAAAMIAVLLIGTALVVVARRTRGAILIVVVTLIVAFVGPSLASVTLGSRFVTAHGAVEFHCAGSTPTVCLAAGHTARLKEVATRVDGAARVLASAGVTFGAVRLYEELVSDAPQKGTLVDLAPSNLNGNSFSDEDLAAAFSRPTDCAQYSSRRASDSEELLRTAADLTEWMSARLSHRSDPSRVARLSDHWARGAYEGLLDCRIPPSVVAEADSVRQ